MEKFLSQKNNARRRLLNSRDFINFSTVPMFIVNSFFDECTYKKRLQVTCFCFLNGLSPTQCLELCFFKDLSKTDVKKIEDLYVYLNLKNNITRFYSYSVHYKKVFYLNGDLRINGKRIVNHYIFKRNIKK